MDGTNQCDSFSFRRFLSGDIEFGIHVSVPLGLGLVQQSEGRYHAAYRRVPLLNASKGAIAPPPGLVYQ